MSRHDDVIDIEAWAHNIVEDKGTSSLQAVQFLRDKSLTISPKSKGEKPSPGPNQAKERVDKGNSADHCPEDRMRSHPRQPAGPLYDRHHKGDDGNHEEQHGLFCPEAIDLGGNVLGFL